MKAVEVDIDISNDDYEASVRNEIIAKERDALEIKVIKLEIDLSSCKEEHKKYIEGKDKQIKTLTDKSTADRKSIGELHAKVKSLEASSAPGSNERGDLKALNRAELVEMLEAVGRRL